MFFIVVEFAQSGVTVGFASCWIVDDSEETARQKATAIIESQGYEIVKIDEPYEITRDDYADVDEHRQYYEQALLDSEVCVLYTVGEEE